MNLLIGTNGSGKTFFLKALYSIIRSLEESRGDEKKPLAELLANKLYWTFQPDQLGSLISKGRGSRQPRCSMQLVESGKPLSFEFGADTTSKIAQFRSDIAPRTDTNSVYLPAKEVLSLHAVIKKSREIDKSFGFDDTYLDLIKALEIPTAPGKNYKFFSAARSSLADLLHGKTEYSETDHRWYFKQGSVRFSINLTSEGVKKIAILDTLLGNRYLNAASILFIDEPEAALHPQAVFKFMEMLVSLAETGIQIFIALHSYFVVKKLCLLAEKCKISIPILSLENGEIAQEADLIDGMPQNSIINESIEIYREEVDLTLGGSNGHDS